ncbi:Sepiapterin reductase [Symbiodinium microadriaticum]|uniref:Sepiapterin reductase n=1 Tax=Symbiodinium microadriaticum TaxID=2951 RepID=A0A1Q9CVP9_SYMMI|nr:Sepiapterin reductase [Symbiodinium microadriaticum]
MAKLDTMNKKRSRTVECQCFVTDLGRPDQHAKATGPPLEYLAECLKALESPAAALRELVIVHNAGSLGRLAFSQNLEAAETAAAMELNVTCPILLTQDVLRRFGDQANARGTLKIRIVNISSLLAIQVMPSWSLYSVGKAARDMHMKSVAADARRSGLDVRTLSWAPGPMDTKMVQEVLETCPDTDVRAQFQSMYESDTLVDARYSAAQLMVLLNEDFYENGSHKDIYDIGVPPPAPAPGSEQPLTPELLAEVPQRMQKQLLGERLYPHVARSRPEIAGRITSMLLEMENSEVLMLLQSEQHLQAKVDEARRLLELYSNVSPPVNPAEIAGQPPEVQRQYFGERLYPRVARYQPELAGKITGLLATPSRSS